MKKLRNYSKFKPLAWLMASILAVIVAGCGGGSGSAPGMLGVSLTRAYPVDTLGRSEQANLP